MLLCEAVNVVREAQPFADVQEQSRAHALAEDGVQEVEHEPIGMKVVERAYAQADVRLLRLPPAHQHARAKQWLGRYWDQLPIRFGRKRQAPAHRLENLLFAERTGRSDDEVWQPVVSVGIFEDVVSRESGDRLLRAGDVSPERMVGPHDLLEKVLHQVL